MAVRQLRHNGYAGPATGRLWRLGRLGRLWLREWGRGLGHRLADVRLGLLGLQQSLLRPLARWRRAAASRPAAAGRGAYNYSQPISTTAAPPEQAVAGQATSAFDQARDAFKAGDYGKALQLDQQALAQTPNDTNMHEFLALVLFAQGKYDQAAAPLYAVLSVGPGWDWTTLSGMYPDVDTYTHSSGPWRPTSRQTRTRPRPASCWPTSTWPRGMTTPSPSSRRS